jgi:2-iminobutanoate/2-iminopropanoate deaminase
MNKALFILAATLFAGAVQAADSRTFITPPGANPKTAAPFSSGVLVNGTYYVSGSLGLDPATGKVPADAEAEARLVLDSVKQTLARAGLSMDDLVSVTIYCTDLDLYEKFNAIYRTYFQEHYPSRAFIGVAKLVRGARFEVAGIAVKPVKSR